jgi:hypothetical protein
MFTESHFAMRATLFVIFGDGHYATDSLGLKKMG